MLLLVILAGGLVLPSAPRADEVPLALKVKAAMLYKFLGYIEWPPETFASPDSPYVIAVIDADAIASELVRITTRRTVNDRPIEIFVIDDAKSLDDGIHMLFIGGKAGRQQERLLELAQHYSIVTVTENPEGLDEGSVINLRLQGDRIQFDVSLLATERRNLKVSARMLAVASTVEQGSR